MPWSNHRKTLFPPFLFFRCTPLLYGKHLPILRTPTFDLPDKNYVAKVYVMPHCSQGQVCRFLPKSPPRFHWGCILLRNLAGMFHDTFCCAKILSSPKVADATRGKTKNLKYWDYGKLRNKQFLRTDAERKRPYYDWTVHKREFLWLLHCETWTMCREWVLLQMGVSGKRDEWTYFFIRSSKANLH